jgi:hypothetical protein
MEEIKEIQKKYCSQALIFAIIVAFFLILVDYKAIGKGFLLGTLFSILNFIIMGQLLPLKLAQSSSKAAFFALFSIFIRFAILAVPLIISLKIDAIEFFSVVVGLFSVQFVMLFHHLILNRISFNRKI